MPWARFGDTAATDPRVLRVAAHGDGDDRLVNEVFGFFTRCSTHSAGHMTDYVIDEGAALQYGGARTYVLVDLACRAGLMTKLRRPASQPKAWRLVDNDPDFLHIRLRDEVIWERQRKRDASNPALIIPVRLRDGDACRYCGEVVNWKDRRGQRAGTYDHREPGRPATVDTYVVSCFGCNRARGDDPDADSRVQLLPAPARPYYSATTLEWLARNGVQRPGSQPDTAQHNGSGSPDGRRSADSSRSEQETGLRPGAGRDGSGQVGPGLDGTPARRPRGRRGGASR